MLDRDAVNAGYFHRISDVVPIRYRKHSPLRVSVTTLSCRRRLSQRRIRGEAKCRGSSLIPRFFGLFGLLRRLAAVRLLVFRDRLLVFRDRLLVFRDRTPLLRSLR